MNYIKNTSAEVWKDIPEYEGVYQVSSLGAVKSLERWSFRDGKPYQKLKEKLLKPWKDTRGYTQVYLCRNGSCKPVGVHRLVMIAFKELNPEKPTVNHLNGTLDDNRLQNLEWTTQKENNNHAFDTGLMDNAMGERRSTAGLSDQQALEIYKLYLKGKTQKEISEIYSIKKYHVNNIIHGKSFRRVTKKFRENICNKAYF